MKLTSEARLGRQLLILGERGGKAREFRWFLDSQSQLGQDFFVLGELGIKRGGFFVEIGGGNGIKDSNTFLLERHFEWRGVMSEPIPEEYVALSKNRSCFTLNAAVWSNSENNLKFILAKRTGLSTILGFENDDHHASSRKKGHQVINVQTVSLEDLLVMAEAPTVIDYLSLDTEGSEWEILKAFDFENWQFRTITVEHNFSQAREAIFELLSSHGYIRVMEEFSVYDDWYVFGS